ncbi:MAG: adenine deaminase [Desulfobacteraceae bacterium 4572_130]|nr:MAG: adenine deaminase [Desulfobacteraceae bacterium 4572_130]
MNIFKHKIKKIENKIDAAAGRRKADILFLNARIVNVFTGEIIKDHVAVKNGYFCGFGKYDAKEEIDVKKMFLAPGFIDAHVHIESSMVTPYEFSRAVIPFGTTTVIADPHEIANVIGIKGIEYMIESAKDQLMNILFAIPSCVPATLMETSGDILNASKIASVLKNKKTPALAEMMNYPGVIYKDTDVLKKIITAQEFQKPIDGHAPKLTDKNLAAYVAAGILSDHECTNYKEALEKLRLGMHIMVRQGTCAKNLEALIPAINHHTWRKMMWCTDDRHPKDILKHGHINYIIKKAINSGVDPIRAIQMGTINTSDYFANKNIGAIAPGRRADFVVFKDLKDLKIEKVYAKGILAAEDYTLSLNSNLKSENIPYLETINIDINKINLKIVCKSDKIRVIEVIPEQVITNHIIMGGFQKNGDLISNPEKDLLKIAVIERYSGKNKTGKGFVKGIGLLNGAIASSVAHDSHNIIVVGTNDNDMLQAVKKVFDMQGGFAVACDNKIIESLALPVAGLMAQQPMAELELSMEKIIKAVKDLGSPLKDPFMSLSFLSLPVIPALKITDKGLVDVEKFKIVDLHVFKNKLTAK